MYERSLANPSLPKLWVFNSFFFKRLREKGYSSVKRWAKKAKPSVFAFDLILVPVHVSGNHWCCGSLSLKEKTITCVHSTVHNGTHCSVCENICLLHLLLTCVRFDCFS
eukprot:m.208308 g.208308  ORF g.208308 m.208308 type:complete len:109 (-) comp13764_c1_seq3:1-327(-)